MKYWLAMAIVLGALCVTRSFAAPRRSLDSPHFTFYFDPDDFMIEETVQRSAEAAFGRVSGQLDFAPTRRIPVYLYGNRADFNRDTGAKGTELVLGMATSSDRAIRLDASRIFDMPDRVIGHETVHIFLDDMLGPYITVLPLWMNEGLAQVGGAADPERARVHVTDAIVNGGGLIPLSDLTSRFPEGNAGSLAYDESQTAVETLLEKGDWPKMRFLLNRIKAGESFESALQAVYGMTVDGFQATLNRNARFQARYAYWATVAEWVVPFMMFAALVWGIVTVRRHRRRQIIEEEPLAEIQPPSWWKEDQWR